MHTKRLRVFFLDVCLILTACAGISQGTPVPTAVVPSTTPSPLPTDTALPSPTPTPVCHAVSGSTTQVKFHSETMEEEFTFSVYLPPCYNAALAGGYPVIYLFHGNAPEMNDTYWTATLGINQAADQAIDAGGPAFIMVFPYEVNDWDPPLGTKFGDAVMDDLIPYVQSHYNVCTSRQCREIGGFSRGAGWAMHLGLTHLDMFSAIGAHSLGWFQGDLYRVQNLLAVHSAADFPRIYMDRGDQDYLHASIDLYEQNLKDTGIAHVFKISPGVHDKAYWQSQVGNYVVWYELGFAGLN
jgi:enterochelin esterase-like enzyme